MQLTTDTTSQVTQTLTRTKIWAWFPLSAGIFRVKVVLVADNIDTVEVAFLNGKDTPTIEAIDNDGSVLGRTYLAYIDYAAKAFDYRGMFCNPGV